MISMRYNILTKLSSFNNPFTFISHTLTAIVLLIFLAACAPTSAPKQDAAKEADDVATANINTDTNSNINKGTDGDADGDGVPDVNDLDADGDGLIEIYSADELDMIRLDYTGASFAGDTRGCVDTTSESGACNGYELISDIDLADFGDWLPLGLCLANNECPELFTGIFDGNGYSIHNLNIDLTGDAFGVGLFAAIGPDSEIRNLHIAGANIRIRDAKDARDIGAMVGFGRDGARLVSTSVTGVKINAPTATAVGGLIGDSYKAYIGSSSVIAESLLAKDGIGGLTGFGDSAIIENSAVLVDSIKGENYLGGLVGDGRNVKVTSASAKIGSINGLLFIGGLVGDGRNAELNDIEVNINSITGTYYVGGLIGDALAASATQAKLSINRIKGDIGVGGLMGWASNAKITASSVLIGDLIGSDDIGGLIGNGSNVQIKSTSGVIQEIEGEYSVGALVGSGDDNDISDSQVTASSIKSLE